MKVGPESLAEHRLVILKAVNVAARRFGAGPDDVEDAAGEVVVELLRDDARALKAYRGDSAFTTWLTVVSHRIACREFAKRLRARQVEASKPVVALPSRDVEILAELEKLPERERRALVLFHIEEATYQEIASKLAIPANQVGMVLLRAREALAAILKK